MLISELAAKSGLSIDTIRFYEKRGLLNDTHFTRGDNNYRYYTHAAVLRLELIRRGQAAGVTLAEMRQWLDEWQQGVITPAEQIAFFQRKIGQVEERMAALEQVKAYLEEKIAAIEAGVDLIAMLESQTSS